MPYLLKRSPLHKEYHEIYNKIVDNWDTCMGSLAFHNDYPLVFKRVAQAAYVEERIIFICISYMDESSKNKIMELTLNNFSEVSISFYKSYSKYELPSLSMFDRYALHTLNSEQTRLLHTFFKEMYEFYKRKIEHKINQKIHSL